MTALLCLLLLLGLLSATGASEQPDTRTNDDDPVINPLIKQRLGASELQGGKNLPIISIPAHLDLTTHIDRPGARTGPREHKHVEEVVLGINPQRDPAGIQLWSTAYNYYGCLVQKAG